MQLQHSKMPGPCQVRSSQIVHQLATDLSVLLSPCLVAPVFDIDLPLDYCQKFSNQTLA